MSFSAKRQQGLTFISLVIILGFIAFFVLLSLKIAPIYLNHNKVMNALSALEEMEGVETMSKRELSQNLDKRFGMNYVEHVEPDDITIMKDGEYLRIDIEYERVENILGNLSVLVQFHDFFEIGE